MSDSKDLEVPDIGRLLGKQLKSIPPQALPGFLARLERGAADRYREWAEAAPEAAAGLRECAAREDEIAARVERILPADHEHLPAIEAALPGARETYYGVFENLSLQDQWRIQAAAERQGAAAWRGLAAQQSDEAIKKELETCAQLEETSAAHLDGLLG